MDRHDVIRAWGRILTGYKPLLSVEITRECPLRCPGCYAYEEGHLGGSVTLRQLSDFKGDELIRRFLALIDERRPLHVSIVGGDPMVRYRELEVILPELVRRGVAVQLVTSAFRPIPTEWFHLPRVEILVSIDGLQPEHDVRRKPATYERILHSLGDNAATIHFTITALMMSRPSYLEEFMQYWTPRPQARRVWISLFTPQRGGTDAEILSPEQRRFVVEELVRLVPLYPKLDLNPDTLREYLHPPRNPKECVFARTTETISADLKTHITPCQFGGNPDCSQCGCIASMALAGVGRKQAFLGITAGGVLKASAVVGAGLARVRSARRSQPQPTARPAEVPAD